jgi:hypothetical protein
MLIVGIILALLVAIAVAVVAGILLSVLVKMSNSEGFNNIAEWEGNEDEETGHMDM